MRRWSKIAALSISLLFALIGSPRAGKTAESKGANGPIQGAWQAVTVEGRGVSGPHALSVAVADKTLVVFVDNKVLIEAHYTLNPKSTPAGIDLEVQGEKTPGIYDLKDDTLRLCLGAKTRPTAFAGSEANLFMVLARRRSEIAGAMVPNALPSSDLRSLSGFRPGPGTTPEQELKVLRELAESYLQIWRGVHAAYIAGARGGSAGEEARARTYLHLALARATWGEGQDRIAREHLQQAVQAADRMIRAEQAAYLRGEQTLDVLLQGQELRAAIKILASQTAEALPDAKSRPAAPWVLPPGEMPKPYPTEQSR